MRSATFAQSFIRVLCALGLAALAALTLVDRGATRMYAFPWWLLFWFVHLVPAIALLLRTVFDRRPLVLPAGAWCWLPALFAVVELGAALASPFRAQSILAAATPLAALAVYYLCFAWLQTGGDRAARLEVALGWLLAVVLVDSLGLWIFTDILPALRAGRIASWHDLFNFRNLYPLGHYNYTAGLALLALPWLFARARRTHGRARLGWVAGTGLGLLVLFTTGSRGGMLGLAAILLAGITVAWRRAILSPRRTVLIAGAALFLSAGLAWFNPRIRDLLIREASPGPPDESAVERSAMLQAGWQMGADRPWSGFGPGVTPLVYPLYRARLSGGVPTALQLHSLPVQLWADTGAAGLLCALGMAVLVAGALWKNPNVLVPGLALAGYGVFALSDFELDVPVFAFLLAVNTAACAPAAAKGAAPRMRQGLGLTALAVAVLITAFGRSDPTPGLNVEALALGGDPAQAGRAIALLEQSLALNPNQGIAQCNLAWLLVARDPPAAERHFLAAAHLWPDKTGVYFGLGLARLNQNQPDAAVQAFALECANHPAFSVSPWWRVPALAPLREATAARLAQIYAELAPRFPPDHWPGSELKYAAALEAWTFGSLPGREVAFAATTAARRDFFRRNPDPAALLAAPVRHVRYDEPGYPVITRDSDLGVPTDIWEDRENAFAAEGLAFLFPAKGWLPSPSLLEFLDNSGRPEK